MRQLKRGLVWVPALLIGAWLLAQCGQVVHWLWLLGHSALPSNVLWTNIKEFFWPVASAIAVATFVATGRMRQQDLTLRRVDTTTATIQRYNTVIRVALLSFQQRFDEIISDADYHASGREYFDDANLVWFQTDIAKACELASVLHLLDELMYVLKQKQYVDRVVVLAAISSEVQRVLLDRKYQPAINAMLSESTINNVADLRLLLLEERDKNG